MVGVILLDEELFNKKLLYTTDGVVLLDSLNTISFIVVDKLTEEELIIVFVLATGELVDLTKLKEGVSEEEVKVGVCVKPFDFI